MDIELKVFYGTCDRQAEIDYSFYLSFSSNRISTGFISFQIRVFCSSLLLLLTFPTMLSPMESVLKHLLISLDRQLADSQEDHSAVKEQ